MGKGKRNRDFRHFEQAAGYTLSREQKAAMDKEIRRQIAEYDREYRNNLDAIFLLGLHIAEGFGSERLHRVYNNIRVWHNRLTEYYVSDSDDGFGDAGFYCLRRLKELGCDIEKWRAEHEN